MMRKGEYYSDEEEEDESTDILQFSSLMICDFNVRKVELIRQKFQTYVQKEHLPYYEFCGRKGRVYRCHIVVPELDDTRPAYNILQTFWKPYFDEKKLKYSPVHPPIRVSTIKGLVKSFEDNKFKATLQQTIPIDEVWKENWPECLYKGGLLPEFESGHSPSSCRPEDLAKLAKEMPPPPPPAMVTNPQKRKSKDATMPSATPKKAKSQAAASSAKGPKQDNASIYKVLSALENSTASQAS